MMRPSKSLYTAALQLLLLSATILPTNGFAASSLSLQPQQRVAVSVPGRRTHPHHKSEPHQAVALNADYSDWYSPQRVPPAPPSRLSLQQKNINSRQSSSLLQTPLTSVDDFAAFLDSASEHELVLIKFHASWCRSCAKLGRKLDQLAHQYHAEQKQHDCRDNNTPSSSPWLKIGTVEYMAGRDICRALNIEALPTIHLYTRDPIDGTMEKVQDFSCPPSAFDQVQAYCRYYVDRTRQKQQKSFLFNEMMAEEEEMQPEEQSFTAALDRGSAMMEASLQDTQKAGKLRSGWRRLWVGTGNRLRRVVNGNIEQEAAIALLD